MDSFGQNIHTVQQKPAASTVEDAGRGLGIEADSQREAAN
jgi:hypothetical protein